MPCTNAGDTIHTNKMDIALAGPGLYYYYYVFFDVVIINDTDLDFCLALLLQHAESNRFHKKNAGYSV
jgi:hypothetical protein